MFRYRRIHSNAVRQEMYQGDSRHRGIVRAGCGGEYRAPVVCTNNAARPLIGYCDRNSRSAAEVRLRQLELDRPSVGFSATSSRGPNCRRGVWSADLVSLAGEGLSLQPPPSDPVTLPDSITRQRRRSHHLFVRALLVRFSHFACGSRTGCGRTDPSITRCHVPELEVV
jgi:hypothetical protein